MRRILFGLFILTAFFNYSWASEGYNMQKGVLIGAVDVAGGAFAGGNAGNNIEQNQTREYLTQASKPMNVSYPRPEEGPPGEWVEVPGTWVNGQWVPAHKVWVPVNPGGGGQVSANPQYAPPPYTIHAPPPVVPIQGTYTYFIPDIGVDILFYHGYWYRPHAGHWYRATTYNGPWAYIVPRMVPGPIIGLPPDYRRNIPPGYRPVRYGELQRNWERWERVRYWDHYRGRR